MSPSFTSNSLKWKRSESVSCVQKKRIFWKFLHRIQLSLGKIQHPLKRVASLSPNKPEMHPLKGEPWFLKEDLQSLVKGDVFYRLDDDSVITISNFYYPSPGPDAFFWVGETGKCDVDSIGKRSYPLAPGKVGSRMLHHSTSYFVFFLLANAKFFVTKMQSWQFRSHSQKWIVKRTAKNYWWIVNHNNWTAFSTWLLQSWPADSSSIRWKSEGRHS